MLPAHSIVIYPLTLEAVLKTDATANRIYLLRKSMQDQPNKPRWICYSTHFLEEEFCVLKLTFLTLLSAESKQITCQSCPTLKVYQQLFFNLTRLSMQHNLCFMLRFSLLMMMLPMLLNVLSTPALLTGQPLLPLVWDKHCFSKWFIWYFCCLSLCQELRGVIEATWPARIYTLGRTDAWTGAEFSQKETILL